jgi:hypothetical protein
MSHETPWSKRIEATGQFLLFNQLREQIEDAEIEHADLEAKVSYDRILKGVVRLFQNIQKLDLDLLSPQILQGIHGPLNNISAQVTSYISNKDVGHLTNAHAQLDALIQTFPYLFFATGVEVTDDYKSLLKSFSNTANGHLGAINKSKSEFEKSLGELNTQAASVKTEITQYQKELSTLRQENSTISSQQNETFIKSQQERDEDFQKTKTNTKKIMDTLMAEEEKTFSTTLLKFEKRADERVSKIQKKLDEAKKVFQNLGVVVQTGKYQEFADKESKMAGGLRIGAIVSLVLMFAGTIGVIFTAEQQQITWNLFLLRFITVATLSIPALYFAHESTRHRQKEHHYRKIQLELTSLTPFIEFFDEKTKKEIKRSLVEKYFGKEDMAPVDDDQLLKKKDLMEIISKIPTN